MKKYVQISSKATIRVNPGLYNINSTNMRSPIADRLSVKPAWTRFAILIEPTRVWYPAEVQYWNAVKSLVANGKAIIGIESDVCDDPRAEQDLAKIERARKRYESEKARNEEVAEIDRVTAKQVVDDTYDDAVEKPKARKPRKKKSAVPAEQAEITTE